MYYEVSLRSVRFLHYNSSIIMSAHQQMRLMLDELMGTCRNGEKEKLHFSNTRVCKSFLLNCCSYEILAHTRFNLGKCPKVHDVALKADFEKSREFEHEFQVEAYQQLNNFIVECKRRTRVAKLRLAAAQDALNVENCKKVDHLPEIDGKINDMIEKAEKLGADGDVDEALKLMKEVDVLKLEKSKTSVKGASTASHEQQKKLRICEVCSSYLGLSDDDKRMADHFCGRLHLGFLYIREKHKELEDLIQDSCIKEVLDNEFKSSPNHKRDRSPTIPTINESQVDEDFHTSKRKKPEEDHLEKL